MKRLFALLLLMTLLFSVLASCQDAVPDASLPSVKPTGEVPPPVSSSGALKLTEEKAPQPPATDDVPDPPATSEEVFVPSNPVDPREFSLNLPDPSSQFLFYHRFPSLYGKYLFFCAVREDLTLPPEDFLIYYVDEYRNVKKITDLKGKLPSEMSFDSICPVTSFDRSNSKKPYDCEFVLQLIQGEKVTYVSFDNLDASKEDPMVFACRGELSDERLEELKKEHSPSIRKAQSFFRTYSLEDFAQEPTADEPVYEAFAMDDSFCCSPYDEEYPCEHPFHISLPLINGNTEAIKKLNEQMLADYGKGRINEWITEMVYGANDEYVVEIDYQTVTSGHVITVYVYENNGLAHTGAVSKAYHIYHYDTKEQRFLTTEEFLAYYVPDQALTLSELANQMYDQAFNTDDGAFLSPLTEEDIIGVIPSIFGKGKFDVVYQHFSVEGSLQIRSLYTQYPSYSVSTEEGEIKCFYHLSYKEGFQGDPSGYVLALIEQKGNEVLHWNPVSSGLLLEDVAEPTKGSSSHKLYQLEDDGTLFLCVDHKTDQGHRTERFPYSTKVPTP